MKKFLLITLLFVSNLILYSQSNCNTADPFCTGTTYNFPAPIGQTAQAGPDYGCLLTQPNPVWYYLQIGSSGTISMSIGGASPFDDIDFVCWGPFSSPTTPCTAQLTSNCSPNCLSNTDPFASYPSGNIVDCSYDAQAVETCTIPNAITGQYYIVCITNFGGNSTNIIFNQTNTGQSGAGSTNCNILCNITAMNATPGPCQSPVNTFNATGIINTYAPPNSGTLTITSSCGGSTVLNPPFSTSTNYTLTNLSATGGNCTLTAVYSADPLCTYSVVITSPQPCNVQSCAISSVTANAGPCNTSFNTYDLSGSVVFSNPPASGVLTITNSCGGSQVFNPPFSSPISYTLSSLPSNGQSCTVTAVFSSSATCTGNATFQAPPSCSTCTTSANNSGPVCEGQTINLTCSASGAMSYSWTGPNSYSSNQQNPSIVNVTSNMSGTYSVTVTMPGGAVCNALTTVVVNPNPNADAGPTVSICSGGSVQLSAVGGNSYSWTPATGLSNNAVSNPNASPANSTQYTVTIGNNGCFDTDTITVFVISQVIATVSLNQNICIGQSAQLIAGGGSTYSWSPPTGLSSTIISNPVASPTATTTYTVNISASGGCPPSNATVTVNVYPTFNIIVSPDDIICPGEIGSVSASGAINYVWSPGGSTNDTLFDSPSSPTTYTVAGSNGFCADTQTVMIDVLPNPNAQFAATSQTELGNFEVCFNNTSTGGVQNTISWNFGDGNFSSLSSPCHQYLDPGIYLVCLSLENSIGCGDTACTFVDLKPDWTLYVPNAFTPNSDGLNDVFYAVGTSLISFSMDIFDRWGNLVYSSVDINEGWNGTMKNSGTQLVQIDTYVWKINITDSEGNNRTYTGNVNLIN